MNRNVVFGLIVITVIAVVGYQIGAADGGGAALAPIELEESGDAEALVELAQGVTLGDPDAPITIVEFGDYQCPGCAQFNMGTKPQMVLSLIDSGEAKFIYYDYPLTNIHPWAFLAARAARCAGDEGEYWAFHDALFANQPSWSASSVPPVGDFQDIAGDLGIGGDFRSCLRSDRYADVVTANLNLALQLGVPSTPTVMISMAGTPARRVMDTSYLGIQAEIESLRSSAAAENAAGGGN